MRSPPFTVTSGLSHLALRSKAIAPELTVREPAVVEVAKPIVCVEAPEYVSEAWSRQRIAAPEFIFAPAFSVSAAGAALGVDRLVMALVGAGNIVDVRAPA